MMETHDCVGALRLPLAQQRRPPQRNRTKQGQSHRQPALQPGRAITVSLKAGWRLQRHPIVFSIARGPGGDRSAQTFDSAASLALGVQRSIPQREAGSKAVQSPGVGGSPQAGEGTGAPRERKTSDPRPQRPRSSPRRESAQCLTHIWRTPSCPNSGEAPTSDWM